MTHQTETAELIQAAAKLDPSAWLSAEGTPVRLHPDAAAALGGLLVAIAHTDDETLNKASLVRSAAFAAARVVTASSLDAACAHCGSNDHTWDDCEAYTQLTADAYARTLNTPPSAETCAAIRDRLHSGSEPAAVSAAVAPPTQAAPSLRAGLRDEIVKALGRITTVPPVAHRREQADHVLAVLYREWPWLRAEAEDAEPTDRAALRDRIARALDTAYQDYSAEGHGLPASDMADAVLAVLPEPTDQAPVLREAEAELYVLLRKAGEPRDEAQALIDRHRDEVLRRAELRRMADETATETPAPRRGDAFEQWLKARRDEWAPEGCQPWQILDQTLEEYRLHADTGTPLGEHVCEGKAVGDCECLEQPAAGARQGETPDVQTQPATPMTAHLTTPCDACNHTLNWHSSGETGCTVLRCACARYYHAAGARRDGAQQP